MGRFKNSHTSGTLGSVPRALSARTHTLLFAGLGVALTAAVAAGSLMPWQYKAALHTHGRFHSWIHVLAFGAIAFVAARSTRSTTIRALLLFASLVFGLLVEVLESVAFHGALEWRDVLVDAIGISVATLLALLLDRVTTTE